MVTVSATEASRTSTGVKRRSSAVSFSMCCRDSSWVVAPMQGNSPRASAALSSLAASCGPSPVAPAPMMVWTSSMKTTTRPSARLHLLLDAEELLRERAAQLRPPPPRWPCRARPGFPVAPAGPGRVWRSRWAISLHDGGLSDARLAHEAAGCWCGACRGRRWPPRPRARGPTSGSSLPAAASSVRFRPSWESQGKSFGSSAYAERSGGARGRGRGGRHLGGGDRARAAGAAPSPRLRGGLGASGPAEPPSPRGWPLGRAVQVSSSPQRSATRRGGRGGRRPHLHRLQLTQPARHARGEVGEGDVPERGELKPAGGQQLVRRRARTRLMAMSRWRQSTSSAPTLSATSGRARGGRARSPPAPWGAGHGRAGPGPRRCRGRAGAPWRGSAR